MRRSIKEQQNKEVSHKENEKNKALSPLAKEKSNLTYTGETRLRKNRAE